MHRKILIILVSTLCLLPATVATGTAQQQQQENTTMTASQLAQAYFGNISVPAGPNTKLPNDGSVQALRMHAIGTQNYKCQFNETSGEIGWKLQFPLAKLWLYKTGTTTVDTSRPPDGMHYFASVGSGAGWDLGTNCDAGTDPTHANVTRTRHVGEASRLLRTKS
jgi:hypothetical protein